MKTISKFFSDEAGQTATEYMLVISVVVIAIVATAYEFSPVFADGVAQLAADIVKILDTGKVGDVGLDRG